MHGASFSALSLLPPRDQHSMRPVFISYRRSPWAREVMKLSAALRRRGLRTILDVSDPEPLAGRAQYDELRRIILEDCEALVLYMTRNVPESSCVWQLEIPAGLEAFDRGNFTFLPVFRDVSPSEVRSFHPHGRRLSAFAGVLVAPEEQTGETAICSAHIETANLLLHATLTRRAQQGASGPLVLGIRTRVSGLATGAPGLLVDWAEDYARLLVGEEDSAARVHEALDDLCRAVSASGLQHLRIVGPAHLSAGLAVGYKFHRATGFQLEAQQGDVYWGASGDIAPAEVRISSQRLLPGAPDVGLTLALSRPEAIADADAAASALHPPIGGRIVVEPHAGAGRDAVRSEAHARGIVAAATGALMEARAAWGTRGTTHVFMACPFAFATILGHALNAFGPLALYERGDAGSYRKLLTLP